MNLIIVSAAKYILNALFYFVKIGYEYWRGKIICYGYNWYMSCNDYEYNYYFCFILENISKEFLKNVTCTLTFRCHNSTSISIGKIKLTPFGCSSFLFPLCLIDENGNCGQNYYNFNPGDKIRFGLCIGIKEYTDTWRTLSKLNYNHAIIDPAIIVNNYVGNVKCEITRFKLYKDKDDERLMFLEKFAKRIGIKHKELKKPYLVFSDFVNQLIQFEMFAK